MITNTYVVPNVSQSTDINKNWLIITPGAVQSNNCGGMVLVILHIISINVRR